MLRRLFSISFFICIVLAGSIFAEEKIEQIKGQIVITSQTLLSDNKARNALFEGSVVAKTENMTLYSDKMLVYYEEETIRARLSEMIKADFIIKKRINPFNPNDDTYSFKPQV